MGKNVKNKSTKNRNASLGFRYFLMVIPAIIVVITIFIVVGSINSIKLESRAVATVNGEPITVKEIRPKLDSHRAEIFDYFNKHHKAMPDKGFWNTSYKGDVPAEMLKKAALDECINIKVQQILGKEKGLVDDITYAQYLKNLKAENERRKMALKNKQVIYGPQQYTERTYFSVLLSNMTYELKKKIDNKLIITDEDITKYYEEAKKNGLYKKEITTKIEKIALPFTDADEKNKKAAKAKAEEIRQKLSNGEKFSDLSATFGKDTVINIEFSEQTFDARSYREDYRPTTHEFSTKATSIPLGQVSEIFELNNTYYVVKCIEKKEEGFYRLDEVNESIKLALKEEKYTEYINNLVIKAKIDVDKQVYNKLEIE